MATGSLLEASSGIEALELLHELGCTDGLPVVIPTPDLVQSLVLASGLPADLELGSMGPAGGAATLERIATSAVMAGCLPQHMPIVVAAIEAVLDSRFDLTEMQATTHCTAPLLIVNGPAAQVCGPLSGGYGVFGPGNRANASIGRALRLSMINIGGGRAGTSDMAVHGHPGKFTYCFAEDETSSPFEPFHVSLGYGPESSTVTVVGAEAPHSVIAVSDADDPQTPTRLLSSLAVCLTNPGSNNFWIRGGAATVVLNPDHAGLLLAAGYDRKRICGEIYERASYSPAEIERYVPARGIQDEKAVHCFASPEDILVVVAGGGGLYSMVMPSWCAGPHRNTFVTKEIRIGEACEVPWAQ